MKFIPKNQRLSNRILVGLTSADKKRLTDYCRRFSISVSFFLRYEGLKAVYLNRKKYEKRNVKE